MHSRLLRLLVLSLVSTTLLAQSPSQSPAPDPSLQTLLDRIEQLEKRVAEKRRLAEAYEAAFASYNDISFLREPAGSRSNYWLAAILLDPAEGTEARDAVLGRLNGAGYMARPAWALMHKLAPYARCPRAALRLAT